MAEFELMKKHLEDTGLYDIEPSGIVYAELKAYAEGLDIFFDEADELIRECFIPTAESFGLELREALLQRVSLLNTLEGRRNALIKAFSISSEDFTSEGMTKVAESFNASGYFSYDMTQHKVTFNCLNSISSSDKQLMKAQMERYIPAWSSLEII